MKKSKRNKKRLMLAVLLILVLLISIGYAALTTNLSINGTAILKKQTWSVYFDNVQVKDGSVSGAKVVTAPTTSGTTTTNLTWEVSMDTPGEYYEYNVDVVNGGTIDAMVETATNMIVSSALTEAQTKYLDYSIKYVNGAEIEQYDKLAAGERKTITVKLLFKNDESVNPEDLPTTAQSGIAFNYETNYIQADGNAVEKSVQTMGITENDSGVGYYINKGTEEKPEYAIVFADRVVQAGKKVVWSTTSTSSCQFATLTNTQKENNFKKYIISDDTYNDTYFGEKRIIKVVDTNGEDRFIALALSNLNTNGTNYEWYASANGEMRDWNSSSTGTSTSIFKGKTNTSRMIAKWNDSEYGPQEQCSHSTKHKDVWGQIQEQSQKGWFIPSKDEWSAFGYQMKEGNLKENVTRYSDLGLSGSYWSSSQASEMGAWYARLMNGWMSYIDVNNNMAVRLATTY